MGCLCKTDTFFNGPDILKNFCLQLAIIKDFANLLLRDSFNLVNGHINAFSWIIGYPSILFNPRLLLLQATISTSSSSNISSLKSVLKAGNNLGTNGKSTKFTLIISNAMQAWLV